MISLDKSYAINSETIILGTGFIIIDLQSRLLIYPCTFTKAKVKANVATFSKCTIYARTFRSLLSLSIAC